MVLTLCGIGSGVGGFELVKCALPVAFMKFWYFNAYFALFLVTPLLNKFIFSIDNAAAKKALVVGVLFFSVYAILGEDPFFENNGGSALWIIILYIIGALAKKIDLFSNVKTWVLIVLWIASILITWLPQAYFEVIRLMNYVSPTILFNGLVMVVLFSRIKVQRTWVKNVVGFVTPLVFGIYLFQLNQIIWCEVLTVAVDLSSIGNIVEGVGIVLCFSFAIFFCGLVVEFVRSNLAKICRISALSKKIASLFDCIIEKLFIFLN